MRRLSFWLIDVPAIIVTIWYRMFVVLISLISIVTTLTVSTMLLLWFGFGIRWGW